MSTSPSPSSNLLRITDRLRHPGRVDRCPASESLLRARHPLSSSAEPPVSHRYTERPFNIPRVCVCAWKQKANNIEDKKKRTRVRSSASDILKQALLPGVSGRGRVQ